MYCTMCGTAVQEDATFCTACGAQVGSVAPSPPQPQAAAPSPAAAPVRPRRRPGAAVAIILGVVLALVGVGVGAGYWVWSTPPSVDADLVETFVLGEAASADDSSATDDTDAGTENESTLPSLNPVNRETPEGGYAVFLQSFFGRRWSVAYDQAVPEAREWIASKERESEALGAEGPLMEPTEASMGHDGTVTAIFHNLDSDIDHRYVLTPDPAGEQAGFVVVEEIIGDGDPETTRVQMVERDGVWLFAQNLGPVE